MTSPTLSDQLKALQTAQGAPLIPANPFGGGMGLAAVPNVMPSGAPQVQAIPTQSMNDASELNRLKATGSGVSQIENPWLRGLARVGDSALSVLAPRIAAFTPGTTIHHQQLLGQQEQMVANDQANDQAAAQTASLNLQPVLKQQQAALAQEKQNNLENHQQDVLDQQKAIAGQKHLEVLRNHGYAPDEADPTGQAIRPLKYGEMSETQQHVADLKAAQEENQKAQAELKRAQNDPNSPAFRIAKEKADVASRNANTAAQRLGLTAQSLELRRENTDAMLHGTDSAGNDLPGAVHIQNDDGTQTTVGARFAGNAVKQQKAVGSFKDLGGSLDHAEQTMRDFFQTGGTLADPRMVAAMNDPHGMTAQVVHGLLQSGLSQQQVSAITALKQLHEQAGILRSTTGGTASEAGAQRILDTVPAAGDSNDIALSKIGEARKVLGRLAPGQSTVAGGLSTRSGSAQTFREGNTVYSIPAEHVADFKKDHPNAR